MWAIDGDGCFQMTNQELATCAIEGIPMRRVATDHQRQPGHQAVANAVPQERAILNTDLHRTASGS